MTPELIKDVDEKIQMLHGAGIEFSMNVVALLEMMLSAEDADEMGGTRRWYSQVAERIIEGDMSTVTNEEKLQFLYMHDALIGIYTKRNNREPDIKPSV